MLSIMKTTLQRRFAVLFSMLVLVLLTGTAQAQLNENVLQYHRSNDKDGLNIFEPAKEAKGSFDGINVKVGGDFAIQFQGINQENSLNNLVELGSDLNLPSANLNLDVQLSEGVKLHMRTYLSSKHHNETWVKGGHLKIDRLDFIAPGFLEGIMDYTTLSFGLDEINYGDAHFRRTDNARAIYNPFVANYIMDAFTTEAFGEVFVQKNGFLGMVAVSNGKLNQNVIVNDNTDNKISFYGKLGYDDEVAEDLRVRLTGSWYINNGTSTGTSLYGGDRAGSRYHKIMQTLEGDGSNFEGRFNPRFRQLTAVQVNPFVKYKGLEFFGIYEVASNGEDEGNGSFTQLAGELLYRFGGQEQFYLGGRYNQVKGESVEGAPTVDINRVNIGGGWYLTGNIITKIEYVNQQYNGFDAESKYSGGKFSGVNIEAAISF